MLRDLQELIYVLKTNHLRPLASLERKKDAGSKLVELYNGIESGRFQTDEDAARVIYPEDKESSRFRKLKADLRDKLFQTLLQFNTNTGEFSDYQKAYYECHRQWFYIKILTGQNANTAAMYLAGKLLKQAEKFEFSLLCMDIAAYLRIQFGLRESNDKKCREAGDLFEKYRNLYERECLAEQKYTDLISGFVNNRSAKDQFVEATTAAYALLVESMEIFDSYRLHMYGRMIGLMCYTTVNDYGGALEYCEKAAVFFQRKPYEARVPLQIFYYQELICNVQLRQFEKGRESALKCFKMMKEGTFNWFKFQELYLMLALHTEQYEQASQVLLKAMKHPRFQFLPDNARELWRIYESYIQYVASIKEISHPGAKSFKLNRFINDTPIYSRDKSGINIMILIVKILFLISEHKYGQLLDEVEAIEQYCYRYLNEKSTMRSYYFIKLLLQIPLGQYDVEVIQRKAGRYLDKLKDVPLEVANQIHEIEIIPYEHLWTMAVGTVKENTGKLRSQAARLRGTK
jgi:hypothetical protein